MELKDMFIDVSANRLPKNLRYLWVPHLLIKPACRKDMVLLDCFFSSTLSKDVIMVLLSRRVKKVRIETSAPINYPVVFSNGCNLLYYQKVLNTVDSSLKTDAIENLVLKPQDARARAMVADIFRTILKLLCFPEPPLESLQVYVLLGLNTREKRAYIALGSRLLRSSILEEVIYGHLNGLDAITPYL
ncbi:MAG: hypothetical protein QW543_00355 [Sulfolobales archaeon]